MSQLMEKQRTARSLGGLECSCPDSTCLDSSSCIHQAQPKVEPQPSSGRGRVRMLQHRHVHESSNQVGTGGGAAGPEKTTNSSLPFYPQKFFETDSRYSRESSYSQVSSTTMLGGPEHHPSPPSRPLVLSLAHLQASSSAGLVILNSSTPHPTSTTTGRFSCGQASPSPPPRELLDSRDSPDISSATRGEVGSVSAAVNTLNNIHEFGLELHNGSFTSSDYSGLQPVTDSLLSASESRKSDEDSLKSEGEQHVGPLLDFKSAFSDLDNKNDMSFLHETLDLSQEELHRTLAANLTPCSEQGKTAVHQSHGVRHHTMQAMEYQGPHPHPHPHGFDGVNLDAFDMLSDFPELNHYEGGHLGLLNSGHPGPMLSQAATNSRLELMLVGSRNGLNHR